METRAAIRQTICMAMSTAISAMPRRTSRSLSNFSDIAHLTVAFNGMRLTEKQKQWIKRGYKKWREKVKTSPGEWVHLYISKKYPEISMIFEKQKQLSEEYQQTITKIIEMAVESVDSLDDCLGPLLVSYASENGILEEREGFDRNYWTYVSEALCEISRQFPTRKHKWDTVSAWRIIVLFIINKIEYGFQLGTNSLNSTPSFDNPCYKM